MLRRNLPDEWTTWGNDPPEFWSSIINNPELHPEIRDNTVTVYYRGAALIRNLSLEGDSITGDVHYKYVPIRKPATSKYLKVIGNTDGLAFESEVEPLPFENCTPETLSEYKRMMRSVGLNPESHIVHKITSRPENLIVDQEMKFQIPGEKKTDKIDICHFDTTHNCLAFVEVKGLHDTRLRSQDEELPEVIDQLRSYRTRIETSRECILGSCESSISLKRRLGLANRLLEIPEQSPLLLLKKPVLVIGGCSGDDIQSIVEENGEWQELMDGLSEETAGVILCGQNGCNLNLEAGRQTRVFDTGRF